MFDDRWEAALGDRRALAGLAGEVETELRVTGCRKLRVAAAWADAHSTVDHPDGGMLVEQLVPVGPAPCPPIAETCPASLAVAFRTSIRSAKAWIADALVIRHRLPRLWDRVVAGEVYAWKAREIARATAHLGVLTARIVDRLLHDQVELLAWTRFLGVLDATLLQVDPKTYAERAAKAAAQRDVTATQSSDGLRTLIARGTSGDVAAFLALVEAIAEALADEGDEDPYPVRKSKAIGIAAYPHRAEDLLSRGRHRPDPHQDPWERVAAHQNDPTDPWAADLPPAGWETDRHSNYHQPTLDDDGDDAYVTQIDDGEYLDWPDEPPIEDADLDWYLGRTAAAAAPASDAGAEPATNTPEGPTTGAGGAPTADATPSPSETAEPSADVADDDHRPEPEPKPEPRPRSARGGLDLRPRRQDPCTCRPTLHLSMHFTDEAVRTGKGVVRTQWGPITVDQLRQFLGDTCPTIKVYPVLDPAETAAVDNYEIPIALRRAQQIKNPGSIFPFSPCTNRLDLDHTTSYQKNGPPGQTAMGTLGPVARSEHRPKTVGQWRARQPDAGLYVWRSPEGQISLVTNQGTLLLGDTAYTQHLWRAAGTASKPSEPATG